ncbi:MAG: PilN domain-containing protein, partial [Elusimicrobia bacterium]|nr:PilN domain-containing protein [Elusimicrobiota bacterium]
MIKINLVPSEILAKAKQRQLLLQASVVGGLLALILVVVSVGHWYGKHALEIELTVNEAELKRLDAVVKQVEELEKAAAAVRARLNVIEDLLLGRTFYPVFMSEFARSVPGGVRVNSMSTAATTPGTVKLVISAVANSNEDIAAWVKTLEKNAKFSLIELGPVTAAGSSFNFALSASYTSK